MQNNNFFPQTNNSCNSEGYYSQITTNSINNGLLEVQPNLLSNNRQQLPVDQPGQLVPENIQQSLTGDSYNNVLSNYLLLQQIGNNNELLRIIEAMGRSLPDYFLFEGNEEINSENENMEMQISSPIIGENVNQISIQNNDETSGESSNQASIQNYSGTSGETSNQTERISHDKNAIGKDVNKSDVENKPEYHNKKGVKFDRTKIKFQTIKDVENTLNELKEKGVKLEFEENSKISLKIIDFDNNIENPIPVNYDYDIKTVYSVIDWKQVKKNHPETNSIKLNNEEFKYENGKRNLVYKKFKYKKEIKILFRDENEKKNMEKI